MFTMTKTAQNQKKRNCVPEKDHSNTQSGVEANVHESDKKS